MRLVVNLSEKEHYLFLRKTRRQGLATLSLKYIFETIFGNVRVSNIAFDCMEPNMTIHLFLWLIWVDLVKFGANANNLRPSHILKILFGNVWIQF